MKSKDKRYLMLLASNLPYCYAIRSHTESLTLSDLWQRKKKEKMKVGYLPKLTVENENDLYTLKYRTLDRYNHYRRLKKVYREKGREGLKNYILWVNTHQRLWNKQYKKMQVENVNPSLLAIMKQKGIGWWEYFVALIEALAKMAKALKETKEEFESQYIGEVELEKNEP